MPIQEHIDEAIQQELRIILWRTDSKVVVVVRGDHHQHPEMVRFCWLKSQSFLGEREKNDSGLYLMV